MTSMLATFAAHSSSSIFNALRCLVQLTHMWALTCPHRAAPGVWRLLQSSSPASICSMIVVHTRDQAPSQQQVCSQVLLLCGAACFTGHWVCIHLSLGTVRTCGLSYKHSSSRLAVTLGGRHLVCKKSDCLAEQGMLGKSPQGSAWGRPGRHAGCRDSRRAPVGMQWDSIVLREG